MERRGNRGEGKMKGRQWKRKVGKEKVDKGGKEENQRGKAEDELNKLR